MSPQYTITQALRGIELLKDLPDEDLAQLARFSMIRQVRSGETVFRQSEPSPYCFGIVNGEITILKEATDPAVAAKVLSVLGPGVLFGEQALFTDSPRSATAQAKRDGMVIAIQGKLFRDWIDHDKENGVKLLMGILQNTLFRLRQTSDELSVVYGIGRILAMEKPIEERLREAVESLKNTLASVDEIVLYQRSLYWEEYQCLADVPHTTDRPALPLQHALVSTTMAATGPVILKRTIETQGNAAVAVVPLLNRESESQPLIGFLRIASKSHPDAFTSSILLLLSAVSVQFTEALLLHQRQEDARAQTRLQQNRQTFPI